MPRAGPDPRWGAGLTPAAGPGAPEPTGTYEPCGPCAPLSDSLGAAEAEDLAGVLKALSDPVRLRIVGIVARHPKGEVRMCEIAAHFRVTGPTVSHHLRRLREAGILESERRANEQYYSAHPGRISLLLQRLAAATGAGDGSDGSDPGTAGRPPIIQP